MSSRSCLSRRTVLRAAGASIALPFLDAMLPSVTSRATAQQAGFAPLASSVGVHPRAIFCYVPNGVNVFDWIPENAGENYELSPTLSALADHQGDLTVLSGLGHPRAIGGHSGADTWLTGADLGAVPGQDYTNSVSIDQVIASRLGTETRFESLQFADSSGTGPAGHSHTLAFNRAGTPLPSENSPRRIFDRLFVPDSTRDRRARLKQLSEKKSILDSVARDARKLHSQLNSQDQQKLDQYLSSVRDVEVRVGKLQGWIDVPKPEVNPSKLQLASLPGNAHDRPKWIDVMLELSYLSFLTDTTRVITFEWSREAGGSGGNGENHHELSHHGGDAEMLGTLAKIDRFHVDRLARFLSLLKATSDGDSTMLDHTIVMYGSGMNSGKGGEHSPRNLPLLVAGGRQFGFRHGQHQSYAVEKSPPLSNVLLSVAQAMGAELDSFSDSTGVVEI